MVLPREMPNSRTTADTVNIAFAQVNPTVGNVAGNLALVRRMRADAATAGADLVVFPELVLVGYPPEDLVLRPALVQAAADAVIDPARPAGVAHSWPDLTPPRLLVLAVHLVAVAVSGVDQAHRGSGP